MINDMLGADPAEVAALQRQIAARIARQEAERVKLWRATEMQAAAPVDWLAYLRLVRAGINLLVGDEGLGKSLFWPWLVAAITTGRALPEFGLPEREPAEVQIVVTEDSWSHTVRPRLEVAGADLVHVTVVCAGADGSGAPQFPKDIDVLREADPAPVLTVVDAWMDTLPPKLSVKDPQQAREALHPWFELATGTGTAVLLVTHTNRVASGNARDKYGATGELRKKARLTLFAQADESGKLLIGPEKSNLGPTPRASEFVIDSVPYFDVGADDHDDGTVPRLRWVGDNARTARQLIADVHDEQHGEDRQERAEAVDWLREYLELNPGAKSVDAKREAKKAGISERTLQRARKKLDVAISYTGSPPQSAWTLPVHVSRGITGITGINTGQDVMPLADSGGTREKVAQPVVPPIEPGISPRPADMPAVPPVPTHAVSTRQMAQHTARCSTCGAPTPNPVERCLRCLTKEVS